MDALWGPIYDDLLVPEIVPLAPGLGAAAGRRGRRRRHRLRNRASPHRARRRLPGSTFVGYDLDRTPSTAAAAPRRPTGAANVSFEQSRRRRARRRRAIRRGARVQRHPRPGGPRRRARAHPRRAGPRRDPAHERAAVSSNLEDNLANPMAPFIYAVSTLHCLTVSLADGGAGLGTAWGEQTACGCSPTPASPTSSCTTPRRSRQRRLRHPQEGGLMW